MRSMLYTGELVHTRLQRVQHTFRYPLYLAAFELSELAALSRTIPLFGYNRTRPLSLWDRDYLGSDAASIQSKLTRFLRARGCADGIESMWLVTMWRCFGRAFNPVNFYYCLRSDGALRCAAAEVNNTYGDSHLYLLHEPHERAPPRPGAAGRYTTAKQLFVSPFHGVSGDYEFYLGPLGAHLDLRLDLVQAGETVLRSRFHGQGRPLDARAAFAALVRYPLTAALTVPRIHIQALYLRFVLGLKTVLRPTPKSEMTIRRGPAADRVRSASARRRAAGRGSP